MASAVVHYEPSIREAARKYRIQPSVLAGLIQVESAGQWWVKSGAGARGLAQFMPATGRSYGVQYGGSRAAKRSQIFGAAKYLRDLGYHSKPKFALAAYNGGPGNPQYGYAQDVLNAAKDFKGFDKGGAPAARGGGGGGGGGTAGLPAVTATATSTQQVAPVESAGTGIADQLRAEMAARKQQQMVSASGPAPPPFSAGPRMPAGLQGGVGLSPLGAPAGPQEDGLDALLAAAGGSGGQVDALPVTATATVREPGVPGTAPTTGGRPGAPVAGKAWGGSKNVAALGLQVAKKAGYGVTSTKRTPSHNAEVNGDPHSDHLTTARNAWAYDFGAAGGAGRRLAAQLARAYGIKGWQPNSYTRFTIKASNGRRYSVQILQGAGVDHDDHVHLGVRVA